jgi:hypothetical protein
MRNRPLVSSGGLSYVGSRLETQPESTRYDSRMNSSRNLQARANSAFRMSGDYSGAGIVSIKPHQK